jgi:peptide/nickel transport system substrate-binding protein
MNGNSMAVRQLKLSPGRRVFRRSVFLRSLAAMGSALLLALVVAVMTAHAAQAVLPSYIEPNSLRAKVGIGELPPVAERLPEVPLVTDPTTIGREYGRSGGSISMLMARDKDVRQMAVYGYARLVGYDDNLELQPDILERLDNDGDRVFTFHLRPGHRWSDGHPFTAEDFRFFWEDIALNEEVSPSGPPPSMRVNGNLPKFEMLDPYTVRYSWDEPNPKFLRELAAAAPLYIYMPAHYLKQFHVQYADPNALGTLVSNAGKRSWASLINDLDKAYKNDNPELPVLQPWVLDRAGIGTRIVFRRNPFFHRVDAHGQQLPYVDQIILTIADAKLIPAKAATGEVDLQARYLRFEDYTLLRRSADDAGYSVRLWPDGRGSQLALYPNLNVLDPAWRQVWRDVRVRRALSLAVDREEINQVIFYGLGKASANSILPRSTLYDDSYAEAYAAYDIKAAEVLLEQAGLKRDASSGKRLLPDGRPMEIIVESAGESTLESDILLLMRDSYAKLGISLITRPSQREVFRNRAYAGESMMSVWTGLDNGVPDAEMAPIEFAPVRQDHLQWPKWGQYFETHGENGEKPDVEAAEQLFALYEQWEHADEKEALQGIWRQMLKLFAEQVFTIGTVNQVPQPIVVSDKLKNVPEDGLYNWDPGAYFGIHRMDLFYRSDAPEQSAKAE